jgi:hypothetical protein
MRTFIISSFVVLGLSGFGASTAHSASVQQVQFKLVLPGGNDCDQHCQEDRRREEERRDEHRDDHRDYRNDHRDEHRDDYRDDRYPPPPPSNRY